MATAILRLMFTVGYLLVGAGLLGGMDGLVLACLLAWSMTVCTHVALLFVVARVSVGCWAGVCVGGAVPVGGGCACGGGGMNLSMGPAVASTCLRFLGALGLAARVGHSSAGGCGACVFFFLFLCLGGEVARFGVAACMAVSLVRSISVVLSQLVWFGWKYSGWKSLGTVSLIM